MKYNVRILLFLSLIFTLLTAGCAQANGQGGSTRDFPLVASVQGQRIEKTSAGEDLMFQVPIDQAFVDAGQTIAINAGGKVEKGWLRVVFRAPDGSVAWDPGEFGGDFTVNTFYKPTSAGTYQLGVSWIDNTTATFDLSYQAEKVTAMALMPGLGMMLVAVAFVVYALRRGGTWAYLGLGALAWVVTVAIKFVIAIPANPVVYRALFKEGALWAPGSILFYLYVGLLTGITEVLLTWLLLRYTKLGRVSWNKVLAFGAGFGAFEALLLGFSSFMGMLAGITSPQMLDAGTLGTLMQANNPLYGLAPIVERIATIFVHMVCNALLFYGVVKSQSRWLWVSFAFKSLLDSVAGFAQMWGVSTMDHLWTIEAVIIVFGAAAWWGLRWVARRYPAPITEPEPEPVVPAAV